MTQPWSIALWLLSVFLGYSLFIAFHPLRTEAGLAMRALRKKPAIAGVISVAVIVAAAWRWWTGGGFIEENLWQLHLSEMPAFHALVPPAFWDAAERARQIFFYLFSVEQGMVLAPPLLLLTAYYWAPAVWHLAQPKRSWIAVSIYILVFIAFVHWVELAADWIPADLAAASPLRRVWTVAGEWITRATALFFIVFFQMVLILWFYAVFRRKQKQATHVERIVLATQLLPFFLPFFGLYLIYEGLHWGLGKRMESAALANYLPFLFFYLAPAPLCALLLKEGWGNALKRGLHFTLTHFWKVFWLFALALAHFFAFFLIERLGSDLLPSGSVAQFCWQVFFAVLVALGSLWLFTTLIVHFLETTTSRTDP
ncbi:MAG: hypothetical protein AAF514_01950 [Verrucomicrobiota bacterium]